MLRIHQFAKELGLTSRDVLEALEKRMGISGRSHSSTLTDDQVSRLRRILGVAPPAPGRIVKAPPCGSSAAPRAGRKRRITILDHFALRGVGSPQISPDGKFVAYTVRETDLAADKAETRVWMIPVTGGEPLPMTMKGNSASSPRWSPDGRYLSFLASRNEGQTQVWALDRRGGEAQPLTTVKQGVSGYEWSPDGKKLLLLIEDPKPGDMDKEAGKTVPPKPWVIDRLQFKRDRAGYLDRRRTHLYVFTLADVSLLQVTSGDYDDEAPAWSPDGTRIAFVSNRTTEPDGNRNSDIWVVSTTGSGKGKKPLRLTAAASASRSPVWSPDGKYIAYLTVTKPEYSYYANRQLAVIASEGGTPRVLTEELDRNASSPQFSPDGESIFFLLEDQAKESLFKISRKGKHLTPLIGGNRRVGSFTMSAAGLLVASVSEPKLPAEVFVYEQGAVRQLTHTNQALLDQLALSDQESFRCKSKDGTEIEGFLIKPPDFKAGVRYPALLRIHGGPTAQYDYGFHFDEQYYAANGYLVVMMNPRGSTGYGQQFTLGIWRSWGKKDFEDVMAGIDYAIAQGLADGDRLGVGGWSYGGILTNYVITKTTRFKGAVTGAAMTLIRANYGHDQYQNDWVSEYGEPWREAEAYERVSPFNDIDKIVTPTLIMGGEKDWNCPILNAEQLYQALRHLGRTTQLVVYPNESHGIELPSFQKDRLERYLGWFDRYVKGTG